jgi:hypothetical protein
MKIRIGFVSNSSSSSFCIIGVDNFHFIQYLAEAEGFNIKSYEILNHEDRDIHLEYGILKGKVVDFFGYDYTTVKFAGIDAEKLLQTMTIPEACNEFADIIWKKFDIHLPENSINFHFGQCGE